MKHFFWVAFLFTITFFCSGQPSFAAGKPNFFEQLKSRVTQTSQRLYLQLPGDKPGQMVLNQSAAAMTGLHSQVVTMDLSTDMQKDAVSLANIRLHLDGPMRFPSIDAAATEPVQQDLHITTSVSVQGSTMTADANLKMTDQHMFLQLNTVPVLPFLDLTEVKGRWLSFDTGALKQKSDSDKKALTGEQQQKIAEANVKLINASEVGPAKKTVKNDKAVYVISVLVPKHALSEYFATLSTISDAKESLPEGAIDSMLEQVGEIRMTLWIDRSSYFVRHVELPLSIARPDGGSLLPSRLGSSAPMGLAGIESANTVKAELELNFDQFNVPIAFVEPTNAEDGQAALQKIVGGVLSPNVQSFESSRVIAPTELPTLTPKQQLMLQQLKENPDFQ